MLLNPVSAKFWELHGDSKEAAGDSVLPFEVSSALVAYQTARHEWLDMHRFNSLEHAQLLATQWLWIYNNEHPHSAIGGIPPARKLNAA
jgi:transposase InsO family protein